MFFGKARNRQSANGLHVENSISHEFVEKQAETELSKFLKGIPSKDQCVYRKNYNKNEHRQGSGKAEIIDYLVVTKNEYDPVNIISGDEVDIYIKAKFHESVRFPLFGFSIKTIEGIPIYALNTFFIKAFIAPTQKGDTIVSKFSVKMPLAQGDFFIDLGLDEAFDGEQSPEGSGGSSAYASLDRRCSVVHLFVRESELFHGYVNLGAEFQQVSKNGRSES
jgi:lipopolysaccharide transport system ATP-binding protein